jgi:hypothetical protein
MASISEITPSKLLISNFHGIPNGIICGAEDTIYANLVCSVDSLNLEPVYYPICTGPGALTYTGSGKLFTDSIIINYLQLNPGGQQNLCLVYKSGIVLNVQAELQQIHMNIFPNPLSIQTTLHTDNRFINASLTVYNSVGQTVKCVDNLAGQTIIFHRDNLPSGLYFVRLMQDGN